MRYLGHQILLACEIFNTYKILFFWLVGLTLLAGPLTDPNHDKSKSYSGNDNVSNRVDIGNGIDISDGIAIRDKVDNEVSKADRLPPPIQTGQKVKVVVIIIICVT